MNETIETLIKRRSVRKYKSEQIKDEELNQILEAGEFAANGHGYQAGLIVVVQNKDVIKKLSVMNANIMGKPNIDPFYGAPSVLVVFANKNVKTYVEDGSLILGNMMNAACALDIGSCWINRAKEEFESQEGKELLKEWGISEDYVGIGHLTLGYVDGAYPKASPRKKDFVRYVR